MYKIKRLFYSALLFAVVCAPATSYSVDWSKLIKLTGTGLVPTSMATALYSHWFKAREIEKLCYFNTDQLVWPCNSDKNVIFIAKDGEQLECPKLLLNYSEPLRSMFGNNGTKMKEAIEQKATFNLSISELKCLAKLLNLSHQFANQTIMEDDVFNELICMETDELTSCLELIDVYFIRCFNPIVLKIYVELLSNPEMLQSLQDKTLFDSFMQKLESIDKCLLKRLLLQKNFKFFLPYLQVQWHGEGQLLTSNNNDNNDNSDIFDIAVYAEKKTFDDWNFLGKKNKPQFFDIVFIRHKDTHKSVYLELEHNYASIFGRPIVSPHNKSLIGYESRNYASEWDESDKNALCVWDLQSASLLFKYAIESRYIDFNKSITQLSCYNADGTLIFTVKKMERYDAQQRSISNKYFKEMVFAIIDALSGKELLELVVPNLEEYSSKFTGRRLNGCKISFVNQTMVNIKLICAESMQDQPNCLSLFCNLSIHHVKLEDMISLLIKEHAHYI